MTNRNHQTDREREDALRKKPVQYWPNHCVRVPVTYSQLLFECERLHKLLAELQGPETSVDTEDEI